MPISKKEIYKARLTAIKSELDKASTSDNRDATWALASNFNQVLDNVAAEFPDIAEHLPQRVTKHDVADGKAAAKNLDIKVMAEQAINLVALCPD